MTRTAIIIAAALAFAATQPDISAHAAQRDRVFVASYGNDLNPCTFGSPCKTFQQAITVVAAGGEVTAIDSAGFGPITITQSVTITSPAGVEAGIVPTAGADAIDINAASAITVTLRGLTVEGAGGGLNGVNFTSSSSGSAATLAITDCKFDNFTNDGVLMQTTNGAILHAAISNSSASNNGHDGIENTGTNVYFNISDTYALNNVNDGVQTIGGYAGISNTTAAYNENNGFEIHTNAFSSLSNVHADTNGRQGIYISTNPDTGSAVKNSTAWSNGINDVTDNSGTLTLTNNNQFGFVLINTSGATAVGDGTNYISDLTGTIGSQGLH